MITALATAALVIIAAIFYAAMVIGIGSLIWKFKWQLVGLLLIFWLVKTVFFGG